MREAQLSDDAACLEDAHDAVEVRHAQDGDDGVARLRGWLGERGAADRADKREVPLLEQSNEEDAAKDKRLDRADGEGAGEVEELLRRRGRERIVHHVDADGARLGEAQRQPYGDCARGRQRVLSKQTSR
eukprot:6208642-Pleurochrysis_carterae.AAC.3